MTEAEKIAALRRRWAYQTPTRIPDDMATPCAECGKIGAWDCDTDCCQPCRAHLGGKDNA